MKRGFTLIELVMVIVILGILGVVAVPKYVDMKKDAKEAAAYGYIGAARSQIGILWAEYLLRGDATVLPNNARALDTILEDQGSQIPDALQQQGNNRWRLLADDNTTGANIIWIYSQANTGTGVPPKITEQ